MKEYNGHRSWNCWNISLWIANDESIYRFAMDCIKQANHDCHKATRLFMRSFAGQRTPDGAKYNALSVKKCFEGLIE